MQEVRTKYYETLKTLPKKVKKRPKKADKTAIIYQNRINTNIKLTANQSY